MKKSITLSDIAKESGVSRQVVSAILNPNNSGNIRYSKETCQRVIEVANKVNYRPNRAATSLVRNRHGALGMLINRTGSIPSQTLQHLLTFSKERDLIISIESYAKGDEQLPIFIREDCVDGIILFENFHQSLISRIETLKIPAVYVNNNLTSSPNAITFDEHDAMDQAAALFASRGKEKIMILLPEPETFSEKQHYSIEGRRRGLQSACERRGLAPPVVINQNVQWGDPQFDAKSYAMYRGFLLAHPHINAAVLYHDSQAPAFYQAASDAGKRIPEDIAVLGVHFSANQTRLLPGLSILLIDPRELAHTIIERLEKKRSGAAGNQKPQVLKYILKEQGST
ncbi:MAG: LacI family DNA-binding transcriptional regulator, partial [Spirochaetales bacterium]|nr:LacI family DNA-binding transcriptional regulator [Spirochaetales bacterium]